MASQGPNTTGTGADDSSIGTTAWTNPTNITASDDTYATGVVTFGVPTHYLKATNFGFSIPSGATIDGIVVEWERKATTNRGGGVLDNAVRIVKGGTIGSTDKSSAAAWSTGESFISYGSSSDLWGESWTDADINGSTFGAVISAKTNSAGGTGFVDSCRITVYYTDAAGGPTSATRMVMCGVGM